MNQFQLKISLRLFSTLKLDGEVTGGASGSSRIINFLKTYEYIWNSQEFSNYLNNHNNNLSQLSSGQIHQIIDHLLHYHHIITIIMGHFLN